MTVEEFTKAICLQFNLLNETKIEIKIPNEIKQFEIMNIDEFVFESTNLDNKNKTITLD